MGRINFQACELFLMHGFHPCSFNFYHSSLSLSFFLPPPLFSNSYTCTCMHVEGQKSISFIDILLNHSLPYFLIWVSHWARSSLVKLLWIVSKPWGDPLSVPSQNRDCRWDFFFLGCWRVQIWSCMTESFSLSSSICTLRSSMRNIRRQSLRVMT